MNNNNGLWQAVISVATLLLVAIWLSDTVKARNQWGRSGYHPIGNPAQAESPAAAPATGLFLPSVVRRPLTIGNWEHLSTVRGHIPEPLISDEQVLALIVDINRDQVNDFVIGSRGPEGPSLIWYRRDASGWTQHVIESDRLRLEAGGAFHDIDGDGDQDIVGGANNQSNEIWWWENPHPNHHPGTGWTRRTIKNSGENKHHDMEFGNFDDDPATEFVFWNQGAGKLFIVDVPPDPTVQPWPGALPIFTAPDSSREGLAQADVDGDGKVDIVGAGYWFKHTGGTSYAAHMIEPGQFMRVAAGQLVPGGRPEIVQVPGDVDGIARWFQWNGSSWQGHDLPIGLVRRGHSLSLGDVNGDGHLDIFIGEMRFDAGHANENPNARTMLLYGDSQGNFIVDLVATGISHHESKLGDLDGDGDPDILGKPFTWDTPRVDIWLNGEASDPACQPLDTWHTHVIDSSRPWRAVFIDAADVDGDGLMDVLTGAWWYRNPGTPGGVWTRAEIGAPLNEIALVHDFDGDGDPDVLGTVRQAGAAQPHLGSAFVWARNDNGQFTILNNVDGGDGDFLQGAVTGTFAPGEARVVLSWHRGEGLQSLSVPADPAGAPWSIAPLASVTQNEDLSAGDIDGDGDLDLMLGTVWLENSGGTWAAHTLYNTSSRPDRNRLADINGDNRLDVVVGYEAINTTGKLAWYRAPADPNDPWTEEVIANLTGPMSLDVGDADGDGDVDVVVGEHNTQNPNVGRVLLFERSGSDWVQHLVGSGAEHHDGTQFVDIDNDGDLDVISIGWTHDDVLIFEQGECG